MKDEQKIYRPWKLIAYTRNWDECETSILDDLSASWFRRRETLKENSAAYSHFLECLKREHAIETGVIERLYDIKKGITETFIKEGFVKSYLSHGDSDIPDAAQGMAGLSYKIIQGEKISTGSYDSPLWLRE